MNYLVIDLEMCRVSKRYHFKNYRYSNEIIQVGAVLLDERYEAIATFKQYIRPEYGVIDSYIKGLTGITPLQIKHAPLLGEVLGNLITWIGDMEYQVMAWSDNDYRQLLHEINSKGLVDNYAIMRFMDKARWVDYQACFKERFDLGHLMKLEDALLSCGIEPEGQLHDGLDDAINTASIIRKIELDPEFKLFSLLKDDDNQELLQYSMADLLRGFAVG